MATTAASLPLSGSSPAGALPHAQGYHSGGHMTQQQWAFLNGWRSGVHPRLMQLLQLLSTQEVSRSWALVQVWTFLPVLTEGRQALKSDPMCLLGAPELRGFHAGCSEEGVPVTLLGPMGKVWEKGAVKVVQSLENLSRETHPCNRLQGGLDRAVEEVIYIPVFDRGPLASNGVVAVLEVLIASQAHDYMVVANSISCCAGLLDALQLSLSNPLAHPHPVSPPASPPQPRSREPSLGSTQHAGTAAAAALQEAAARGAGSSGSVGPPAPEGPDTKPSSPTAAGVPTPHASPAAASPFAATSASPFDSPTKSPRHPQVQGGAAAARAAQDDLCMRSVRDTLLSIRAGSGGGGGPSPPASFVALPPTGRTASGPPSWPGAGWVQQQQQQAAAAAQTAAGALAAPQGGTGGSAVPLLPLPAGGGGSAASSRRVSMDLDRAPSGGGGGMGRRSLSHSSSFRRNLSNLNETLSEAQQAEQARSD